jgi:hypothetical protein
LVNPRKLSRKRYLIARYWVDFLSRFFLAGVDALRGAFFRHCNMSIRNSSKLIADVALLPGFPAGVFLARSALDVSVSLSTISFYPSVRRNGLIAFPHPFPCRARGRREKVRLQPLRSTDNTPNVCPLSCVLSGRLAVRTQGRILPSSRIAVAQMVPNLAGSSRPILDHHGRFASGRLLLICAAVSRQRIRRAAAS